MTYLDDDVQVGIMKRAISGPGSFATDWPGATDADLSAMLADGFATAQMQGWFATYHLDYDALEVTPDLSVAGLMLSTSYGAVKALRMRLITLQQAGRFKAGPVEADLTPQSNVLVALLKSAEGEIDFIRRNIAMKITPVIGDITSMRLMGRSGFFFETTELPFFRYDQSELAYRTWV